MPYVSVVGERIFYTQRRGEQERCLLFLHGAGGTHRLWAHQVQNLKGVRTCALDLPEHGRSSGQGRTSIDAYRDVVLAFLDALGLEQAILVGHSMGGAIAQSFALAYPYRLQGLVLVGTGARLRVLPAILDGLRRDVEGTFNQIISYTYAPGAPPDLVEQGLADFLAHPPEVLYGDFVACDRFDVMGRLDEITSPTLVICGGEDRLTPRKYAAYLRDHIPGAQLVLVEGAGHMVMVERPEEVTRAIQRFLEGIPHD
jgi:pimeloyl-ACP methyl ester carboxylesterase